MIFKNPVAAPRWSNPLENEADSGPGTLIPSSIPANTNMWTKKISALPAKLLMQPVGYRRPVPLFWEPGHDAEAACKESIEMRRENSGHMFGTPFKQSASFSTPSIRPYVDEEEAV